MEQPT